MKFDYNTELINIIEIAVFQNNHFHYISILLEYNNMETDTKTSVYEYLNLIKNAKNYVKEKFPFSYQNNYILDMLISRFKTDSGLNYIDKTGIVYENCFKHNGKLYSAYGSLID
jgi:hypothetical protein